MMTTLNAIRKQNPCPQGWHKLLTHLGKTGPDDEPLSIATVLDSNGLDDALWCLRSVEGYDREIRLYATWCALQVKHLMTDRRSIAALETAERFANGEATLEELTDASASASAAATDAASRAVQPMDLAAAYADDAAGAAAEAAYATTLAAMATAADAYVAAVAGAAYVAAADAAAARASAADAAAASEADAYAAASACAADAARDAARAAQAAELRRICETEVVHDR